jgi:tRNA pseudouridine55 synthase
MNGVLIVDKPDGMTSHDVVDAVRKKMPGAKVGHAGTLDPNATGVLLVLVGKATKISRFLMELEKEYVFTLELGLETVTLDRWGEVIGRNDAGEVTLEDVLHAASRFRGRYQQIAPAISAIKHKGVPLYKLARRGERTPVKTRVVKIRDFKVLDYYNPFVTLRVVCSSGTYVRSLARDMGRQIGCGAAVFCLRRARVGAFGEKDAVPLAQILEAPGPEEYLMNIEDSLRHMPQVRIRPDSVAGVRAGRSPGAADVSEVLPGGTSEYATLADDTGGIIGIARRPGPAGEYKIERIL